MAKSSVKRAATKPAAAKSSSKASSKPATKSASKPLAAKTGPKGAAAKAVSKAAPKPLVKVAEKRPEPKLAAKSSKPATKVESKSETKPETIKVTAVAKPAVNGRAAISVKPAVNGKSSSTTTEPASKPANGVAAPEAAKSSGRPMLMQGHVPSKSLTKKGTFIPGKLPTPVAKPVKRKIERPEPAFVTLQPPVAQVRTSEKAVKNRAGLSQKDLDYFRDLLLAKRRELVGDMSHMEREALRENNSNVIVVNVDPTDQGSDAYEQEFTLGLVEKDRTLLREINDAMAKLQNGTYGICEGTGNPIGRPRLEAQPWARHSIEFARILEKRKMVFRR